MPDKYGQKLPKEVESKLDAYIERIKAIKWFQPAKDLKREAVDTVAKFAVKTFGLDVSIEYRKLKTPEDWDAARDAAWDAARGAAWDAAWDAAWGAQDLLALNLDEYKKKYPEGNFINLIPLYEMGLYPVGVIDGKMVIYVPASSMEFHEDLLQ